MNYPCSVIQDLLPLYIDGVCSEESRKVIDEHLAGCAACRQLLDYGFANYALVSPEVTESAVPVKLGRADSVPAVPAEDMQLLVDKAQKNQVRIQTVLEEKVTAPVSKGQRLGTLTVKVGEQTVKQVPLVARESVERLTWWDLFLQVLRKITMAKE